MAICPDAAVSRAAGTGLMKRGALTEEDSDALGHFGVSKVCEAQRERMTDRNMSAT